MFSDEGGILGTLTGRYSNGVSNLDAVLKAFDGSTIRVDRIGREPDYVESPALTFGLSVQPIVLAGVTDCHPEIRDRGLLARFVSAIPDVTFGPVRVGYREIEPPPVPPGVREQYHRIVRLHTELEVPDEPAELGLTAEASVLFTAWRVHWKSGAVPTGIWLSSRRGRRRSTGRRCVSPPSCTSRSTHQAPSSPP